MIRNHAKNGVIRTKILEHEFYLFLSNTKTTPTSKRFIIFALC